MSAGLVTSNMYRDLSLLKRHPELQKRYESVCNALQAQYGSVGKRRVLLSEWGVYI